MPVQGWERPLRLLQPLAVWEELGHQPPDGGTLRRLWDAKLSQKALRGNLRGDLSNETLMCVSYELSRKLRTLDPRGY